MLPHAVASVSGTVNATYTYDANGNLTSGAGRTVVYTSFNKPSSISRGTSVLLFTYDAEHSRIKQEVLGVKTTLYLNDPASGVRSERLPLSGGGTDWNNYIFAGGNMVAVRYERTATGNSTRYFHKDHLGSIQAITDETGAVVEYLSYDAWGKRRFANGNDDPGDTITSLTDRGFTGHEHLEEVGLVHMNGRVYDPVLGRMMSADPFIQDLTLGQNWNPYTYALNNPLAIIDPNGYFFGGIFKAIKAVFSAVGSLVKSVLSSEIVQAAVKIAAAYYCGAPCTAAADALFVVANGGSIGDAFKAAVISYATTMAFRAVGDITNGHFPNGINENGQTLDDWAYTSEHFANIVGHAAVGCASSVASGGKCGPGALAAGFGSFAGPLVPSDWGKPGKTAAFALIGGTASVLGGGKFASGAVTAAFGYLFNMAAKCELPGQRGCPIAEGGGGRGGGGATGKYAAPVRQNGGDVLKSEPSFGKPGSQIDRNAFRSERETFWKNEAKSNASMYSKDNLNRMETGRAPIGRDGNPMELHHMGGSPGSKLVPMTRTDHRLGENYLKNHPWLGK